MPADRIEGWEGRLAAVIDAACCTPYVLGQHDCFRLACEAVNALTGVDHWPAWAGRYHTPREALRLLAENGGSFTAAFTQLFGVEPSAPNTAQRGDVLEYRDATGQQHLGVCVGAHVALLGEQGLAFQRLRDCAHVWRIG